MFIINGENVRDENTPTQSIFLPLFFLLLSPNVIYFVKAQNQYSDAGERLRGCM